MDKVTITGEVKDFPLELKIQLDANRIAAEMVHKAIDNTVWDETAFPGKKEKLHKVVDNYKKKHDEIIMEALGVAIAALEEKCHE